MRPSSRLRPLDPRRRRGAVLALMGILLPVLLGMAILGVDLGHLAFTRGDLQHAADAASLAAIAALRDGRSRADAARVATRVAAANRAAGEPVLLDPARDIQFGSFDRAIGFTPSGFIGTSAVRVIARRTADSPAGPIRTLLAGIIGDPTADVASASVASMRRRDLMLVQDITFSFLEEIEDAKDADATLVRAMVAQGLAGDHVGLATFNEAAGPELELTPIPDRAGDVFDAIAGVSACPSSHLPNCGGTHIAVGLERATDLIRRAAHLDAEKVIVLVTDGMPFPGYRRRPAELAADAAEAAGINIFTVTLTAEGEGEYGSAGADARFNAGLVRGFGRAYETPDADELDELLLKILSEMPVRLSQ